MTTLEKAINLLKVLSVEKLQIALYILESLAVKEQIESMGVEELTPEEALIVDAAILELENGLGVGAKDVWREAEV
ncbi:MAG: hypothetical protein PHS52_03370 [Desulfotomaculaceae bacterium]|nr:hypothetical protein [Desulfotomaculaceae bacterium]